MYFTLSAGVDKEFRFHLQTDKTGFSNAGFVQKKPPTVYLPEALIAVNGICPVKEQIP